MNKCSPVRLIGLACRDYRKYSQVVLSSLKTKEASSLEDVQANCPLLTQEEFLSLIAQMVFEKSILHIKGKVDGPSYLLKVKGLW